MNRLLALSLVVLSALPFTAPFDVIGLQPIKGAASPSTLWQTSTGTSAPDVDPSALTVPPLDRVELPVDDVSQEDFGAVPADALFVFTVVSHVIRSKADIPPPGPPSIRPLALRL